MGKVGFEDDALLKLARTEYDDLVSAPSAPTTGQLSQYAKSGRFYQKTAGNVEKVVGPQVASEVDISSGTADNAIVGNTVQDWVNRLWGPTNSEKITYLGNGNVDFVEIFNSSSQVTGNRRAKIQLAYSGNDITSEAVSLYDTDGTTVIKTVTLTHTYSSNIYQTTTTAVT